MQELIARIVKYAEGDFDGTSREELQRYDEMLELCDDLVSLYITPVWDEMDNWALKVAQQLGVARDHHNCENEEPQHGHDCCFGARADSERLGAGG
jgi:dsDNA-binding SOS-regulon protein